ncbi:MAG: aminotransferase class IV [Clostridia bacterium]|nr:aminotransferase class IV [Clostridia bacterium]
MKTLGYYNGAFDEIEKMSIPMTDRVCFFGDGIYDATYSRNYKIFALDEHIDRFYNSASLVEIDIGISKEELKKLLYELLSKMESGNHFVYWQATRGSGLRNHVFPEKNEKANLWITLTPKEIMNTYKKIKVITAEDTRFLHCNIKTLNLLPAVIASEKAKRAGCDETVFHRGERVTECAHSNVSILKNGVFKTAPTDNLILPGIARAHLIKACQKLGIVVDESPFTLSELFEADEIIVSSAGSLGLGVEEIDGKKVGGKAPGLLRKIQDEVQNEFIRETET